MASNKEFVEFIKEQLRILDEIKIRPMMGEYLLYYKNKLIGGIYDDRLLIKKNNKNIMFNLPEEIPYKNAKPMYRIEDVDNVEKIKLIVLSTYEGLDNK